MRRVYGEPHSKPAIENPDNGIKSVIANLAKHLPEFDYELVDEEHGADLICHHAASGKGYTDVLYNHGLYPTATLPGDQYLNINAGVIQNARVAKQIICPSEWVADLFRRDMHLNPHVIHHGVDLPLWIDNVPNPHGYILWNKGRPSDVCNPKWAVELAKINPDKRFVSTFGADLPNMSLTGALPFNEMRNLVRGASIYLATTKESGDIGSREALAAGIPVLAFNHGASLDFIWHGFNGYVADVENLESLNQGFHWIIRNWEKVSKNAKESAKSFSWKNTARKVAGVFDMALQQKKDVRPHRIDPALYMI